MAESEDPAEPEEGEEALNFAELFNGEEHSAIPDLDWYVPWLVVKEEVPIEGAPGPEAEDPEPPGLFTVEIPRQPVEQAWGEFSIRLQAFAKHLPGGRAGLVVEQRNYRDAKGVLIRTDYIVRWKGEEIEGL